MRLATALPPRTPPPSAAPRGALADGHQRLQRLQRHLELGRRALAQHREPRGGGRGLLRDEACEEDALALAEVHRAVVRDGHAVKGDEHVALAQHRRGGARRLRAGRGRGGRAAGGVGEWGRWRGGRDAGAARRSWHARRWGALTPKRAPAPRAPRPPRPPRARRACTRLTSTPLTPPPMPRLARRAAFSSVWNTMPSEQ